MTTVSQMFRSLADCPAERSAVWLTDYAKFASASDWSTAFARALEQCVVTGKPLFMPAGLYPVEHPIVLNKSHWGLCIFGPGATVHPTDEFKGYGVFEFRDFKADMDRPGARIAFYDFAVRGVPHEKLSEQKGVGFAVIDGYPKCMPSGTMWHNVRCEHLLYGWDLSGAFTFLLDHVTGYRCSQGLHAKRHLGVTRINSSELRHNGYGIYLDDADISTVSVHNTVLESNGGFGIHAIGNYGVVDIRCCHFENNPTHIAGDGGLELSVECCQFGTCRDQHVRLMERPGSQTLNTYFRLNRFKYDRPEIVLKSAMTEGWHVFDGQPVFDDGIDSRPIFAHPDGLRYWEAGAAGDYRLVGSRKS